jgi:hypothetical protein
MDPEGIAIVVVLVALNVASLRGVRRIWRHETAMLDRPPAWWAWSERGWDAVTRCLPVSPFVLPALSLAILVSMVVPQHRSAGFAVPWWFAVPTFVVFGLSAMLLICIALFNRPKAFVAPHLRSQRGLLG